MACRYFRIGGITIKVISDLPIDEQTFLEKFKSFTVDGSGEDTVSIHHHFGIPEDVERNDGIELYRKLPWTISKTSDSYIYHVIAPSPAGPKICQVAVCSLDHTVIDIYHNSFYEQNWLKGELYSLTMFSTDQIIIARLLADRQGFYLHSSGAIVNGAGFLFVGHSEAGKSTITNFLIEAGSFEQLDVEILCDDRNIVCRKPAGWRVYGTWSHGDVPVVSSADAPIKGICFIEKDVVNQIEPLVDRKEIARRLLACLIKPLVTADWWDKTFDIVAGMVREVPCYRLKFDKSGAIVQEISRIANG